MLRNQVDDDRLKLFPKRQRKDYLRQCDERDGGCNDAELVAEMRREGTLKVLDARTYGIPAVRSAKTTTTELEEGFGFKKGDSIIITELFPWAAKVTCCKVQSVLPGGFIRDTLGRLYPVDKVKHI